LSRVLFKFCLQIWNQCKILRLLVPTLTYLKKKVFSSNFWKIIRGLSILLNSMVLSRSGEGAGDTKFLLKCLALHPICLKTFVVFKVCSSIYRLYPLWCKQSQAKTTERQKASRQGRHCKDSLHSGYSSRILHING